MLVVSGVDESAIWPATDRQLIPVDASNCELQDVTGAAIPGPPLQSACVTVFTPTKLEARVKRLVMSMTRFLPLPDAAVVMSNSRGYFQFGASADCLQDFTVN